MDQFRLDLQAIEQSLRDVQREFPKINELLQSRRDSMTDAVRENMLAGYSFVDRAVADGVNLFTLRHATALLEINHIVLCGLDEQVRQEYQAHIEATTQRFYEQEECNIDDILRWYYKHEQESAWKRAAGIYVRILSQPQLYIEGNHRTGALIMSYILMREGKAPFVLTVDNAKAYFDPSTLVKETKKTAATLLMKLPRMKKLFADFLRHQTHEKYGYGNVMRTDDSLSGAGHADT
jgi:prophage maintenance system killer protein